MLVKNPKEMFKCSNFLYGLYFVIAPVIDELFAAFVLFTIEEA